MDGIDVEDGKGVFGAEGKGDGLDAAIAVGPVGGAMKRHDGGGFKHGDRFWSKEGSIAMFVEGGGEGGVRWVSGVDEVFVRLLESKDVEVGGGCKGRCTVWGIMKALVPCTNTEDGGMLVRSGCGQERGAMLGRR